MNKNHNHKKNIFLIKIKIKTMDKNKIKGMRIIYIKNNRKFNIMVLIVFLID